MRPSTPPPPPNSGNLLKSTEINPKIQAIERYH